MRTVMVQHHEQPGHHPHHHHHHKGHHHHHHPHESNSDHLKQLSQPQKFPDTPDNHDGAVGKKSEDPDSRLNLYDKKTTVAAVAQEVGTTVTYRAQHVVKQQDGSQGRPSGEQTTRIAVTESQTQATASGDSEHDRDQDRPHGRSQNGSEVRYWFLAQSQSASQLMSAEMFVLVHVINQVSYQVFSLLNVVVLIFPPLVSERLLHPLLTRDVSGGRRHAQRLQLSLPRPPQPDRWRSVRAARRRLGTRGER